MAYFVSVVSIVLIFLVNGASEVYSQVPSPDSNVSQQTSEPAIKPEGGSLAFRPPFAKETLSRLTVNGYFRNETGFRLNHPSAFSKILNILNLDTRYSFGRTVQLSSRTRAFYDSVYDFEDIDTISPRKGPISILSANLTDKEVAALQPNNVRNVQVQQDDMELKELYLDVHLAKADLRMGKQIVRWGVVEGARVTDEINPLDLGEFILRDVEDRYIPLWMLKSDFYWGENTLEAIWIPDLKFHKPAPRESEWEQFRLLDGLEKPGSPLDNPIRNIGNSEIALRLSRLVSGWDLSFSYFYTWDDFPAAFRSIGVIGFGATPLVDPIQFKPRYTRLHIPGITLSKSVGLAVLSAEAAYIHGKVFGIRIGTATIGDPGTETVTLGEIRRDYVKYAVGVDTTLWRTDVSGQILQQVIPNYETNIIQDEVDTVLGLFVRKTLLSNALTAQILNLYFVNDDEWLIRPRLSYSFTDQVKLSFGADLLIGTISDVGADRVALPGEFHFVGFFRNNSRVYTEIQYSF